MLTVLHASDLQCGRPFRPDAADAFIRVADETSPDVIVVSGDLTQRAKKREYALARSILDRLPAAPLVVTPGNHDVPLYRVWERVVAPYRNWRAALSNELDTVTRVAGATFVALNSSAPRRSIVNGRIDAPQLRFARNAFESGPSENLRVLVIHHHFVPVPDGSDAKTLPRAAALVADFESMGVDFVLGGHIHQTHITTSSDLLGPRGRQGLPIIACGTTTSWRGRGREERLNSLNIVSVGPDEIEVVPYVMEEGGAGFEPLDPVRLERPSAVGAQDISRAGDGPHNAAPSGE